MDNVPDALTNYQTSGVLGWLPSNNDLLITDFGRDNYNSLIVRGYGKKLPVPVTKVDYGLTAFTNEVIPSLLIGHDVYSPTEFRAFEVWAMTPIAQEDWADMNTYANQPPATKPP